MRISYDPPRRALAEYAPDLAEEKKIHNDQFLWVTRRKIHKKTRNGCVLKYASTVFHHDQADDSFETQLYQLLTSTLHFSPE